MNHLHQIQKLYQNRQHIGRAKAYWKIGYHLQHLEQLQALKRTHKLPFTTHQLSLIKRFYASFPEINQALTWTHYCQLLKIKDLDRRTAYLQAALAYHWNAKQLARQIKVHFLERQHPERAVNDNYVLEFLELETTDQVKEHQIEKKLTEKIQDFLLELGRGFAFVARQQIIRTETGKSYRIDLVFYHYQLKCFVLLDLKTTPLSHRDLGQMDTYLRLFEAKWRRDDDNPTLGILFTTYNEPSLLHYSMLKEHQHLLASKYQFHLPEHLEVFDTMRSNV